MDNNEIFFQYPIEFLKSLWELYVNTNIKEDALTYFTKLSQQGYYNGYYRYEFYIFKRDVIDDFPPDTILPILLRFPFPHLWKKILKNRDRFCFTLNYIGDRNRISIGCVLLRFEGLRRFKKLFVAWYRSAKEGTLILRNRKDKLPDIRVNIRYYPTTDPYFDSAFSGRFQKDIEDGCVVIHTKKEGTTQEVMLIYLDLFRKNKKEGKKALYAYLEKNKDTMESLCETIERIQSVSKYDLQGHFVNLVGSYIHDYVAKTLYNGGLTCTERLYQFVSLDTVLAEYIWSVNFNTEKKRFALAGDIAIANRLQKKFLQSENVGMLKHIIENKKTNIQKRNSSVYDKLPQTIWNKIKTAENALQKARLGTAVGFRGVRYINSEEIEQAQFKLNQLWMEADRYIGTHRVMK